LANPLLTEAVHLSHFEYKMLKVLRKCPTLSHPKKLLCQNFVRISPATCPNTWRAEHQRKMSFPFSRKISPRHIRKARNIFLWCCRVKRGGGGTIHSFSFRSKKVRANARITPPNETCSELRKRSDFAGAKIALSIFSKPFPPTAEAVNSQSSPQLKS